MNRAPSREYASCPAPTGFERAPDLVHEPSGMRVWLLEPLGILTQVTHQTRADDAMAKFLTGPVHTALFGLHALSPRPLLFVHEWTRLSGYSTGARAELTQWGIDIRQHISALHVILGHESGGLVRMGIDVASAALRLAGIDVSRVEDFATSQRRLGFRPRPR